MKSIRLTQGLVALVDDADFAWLDGWKWTASRRANGKFCAVRREANRTVYMHRFILGLKPGDGREGDHVDHDPLNNQRYNLRVVTPKGNKQNQPSRGGSSRHVGVTWDRARRKWRAQIQVDGVMKNLGRYDTETEAVGARADFVRSIGTLHGVGH